MNAIHDEKCKSDSTASDSAISTKSEKDDGYDVFLSYRRVGGADFAQLLKLQLSSEPFNFKVFLDVENLGTGRFDESLENSLKKSTNVVLVCTFETAQTFRMSSQLSPSLYSLSTLPQKGPRIAWTDSLTTKTPCPLTSCASSTRSR